MVYTDMNPIVDVPDTPVQLSLPDKGIMEGSSSSVACHSKKISTSYGGALTHLSGRDQLVTENARKGRLHFHPCRGIGYSGRSQHCNNSVIAASCNWSASETPSSLGTAEDKILLRKSSHHASTQRVDDQNPVLHKVFPKTSLCRENSVHSNMSKPSILGEILANPSPQSAPKGYKSINLGNDSCCSFDTSGESSTHTSSVNKRKANTVDGICEVVHSNVEHAKVSGTLVTADSLPRGAKSVSRPVCSIRSTGQKRLVRNGCISPHNIAKAKEIAESSSNVVRDVIGIDEVIGKEHTPYLVKGKGAIGHSFSSKEHNAESEDFCDSTIYDGCFAGQRRESQVEKNDNFLRQCDMSKPDLVTMCGHSPSIASASSTHIPQPRQLNRLDCMTNASSKIQRKHDTNPSSQRSDADVVYLGTHRELLSSRSNTDCPRYCQDVADSVAKIDEFSPNVISRSSQAGDDLEARARQIQADEMFARELQGQLYQEMPEVRRGEVQRQSRNQPFQNRLLRRGTQVRNHGSRLARLRSLRGRPSVPFAQQNIVFPSDMDLDMRIELLEALEAETTNNIRRVTQLLNSDREFNENDYEMLLALDENNQEHLGASFDQITNLPQSTVQTESGETCSICLEVPAVGDTIRHLPCLHKFHKDCIDPWLRRKGVCPVCKSNIA
ncbi:hypothetical protein Ancab_014062 [Ancistrocladus abbreviatus]